MSGCCAAIMALSGINAALGPQPATASSSTPLTSSTSQSSTSSDVHVSMPSSLLGGASSSTSAPELAFSWGSSSSTGNVLAGSSRSTSGDVMHDESAELASEVEDKLLEAVRQLEARVDAAVGNVTTSLAGNIPFLPRGGGMSQEVGDGAPGLQLAGAVQCCVVAGAMQYSVVAVRYSAVLHQGHRCFLLHVWNNGSSLNGMQRVRGQLPGHKA